jgi:plastocyanin
LRLGLVVLLTLWSVLAASSARPAYAATTWQATIGAESADKALQAQAFGPATITVKVGDTVNWTLTAFAHTVAFLSGGERPADIVPTGEDALQMFNPVVFFPSGGPTYDGSGFVNSGVLEAPGATFGLTFTKAGSYGYVCLIHPGMAGTVVVQDAGGTYPLTQAQIDAQAAEELGAALARAEQHRTGAPRTAKPTQHANGTTSYTVANGIGGSQASVLRFLPAEVTVKAGDSITWRVQDPYEIHTVTFYDPAAKLPELVEVREQPDGPPRLIVQHGGPEGGTAVQDQRLYGSGILGPDQAATFTFPKPGVYSYVCLVHPGQGMFGKVTVQAGGPVLPLPNTGVAGAPVLFPETGYSLEGELLSYWHAHGGLPVFGMPVDSARQVDGQVAQWLERARFELHPEHAAPYRVLLGRLGVEALERQGVRWQSLSKASASDPHYFTETGHAIAYGPFWSYWARHGLEFDGRAGTSFAEALALFGYPVSEAQMERNASGDMVLTQWFERARFEYHPNNPTAYQVLLGRLGAELQGAHGE